MTTPKLRVARPSDNLEPLLRFYRDGLGMQVLSSWENHNGFDGLIVGQPNGPYHLEFTHHRGQTVGKAPTQDNLLVFYLSDEAEWTAAVERMQAQGYAPVPSYNPWWDNPGLTFEDPDGYRVVLFNAAWSR